MGGIVLKFKEARTWDREPERILRLLESSGTEQASPRSAPNGLAPDPLAKLNQLIALDTIKNLAQEIQALQKVGEFRRVAGLRAEPQVLHMVFTGNPGTGKSTTARILAEGFRGMGILAKGHLIEVERADLVGEYVGHTAQKTREHIQRAQGGILFVDEAYSLARGGERDFGRESIETLVKGMEDHGSEFILILAGYPREMAEFLASNPGLRSRFPIRIDFPDYRPAELLRIAEYFLAAKEYRLSDEAHHYLEWLLSLKSGTPWWPSGNARTVRNLLESAIRKQSWRLSKLNHRPLRAELERLEVSDLREAGREQMAQTNPLV